MCRDLDIELDIEIRFREEPDYVDYDALITFDPLIQRVRFWMSCLGEQSHIIQGLPRFHLGRGDTAPITDVQCTGDADTEQVVEKGAAFIFSFTLLTWLGNCLLDLNS